MPNHVFEENFGGKYKDGKIKKNLEFEEYEAENCSTAYMLVYIKKDQAQRILQEINIKDIPY